ncbi:MAG: hypothetical protein AB1344_06315 [Pseudomonadota bacterium]
MDAGLTEQLLHSPDKLREHLASQASMSPMRDALALSAVLSSSEFALLHGKTLVECLEAAWPSASEWLKSIERKINLACNQSNSEECEDLHAHNRLSSSLLDGYQRSIEELRGTREPWWGSSPRLIALTRAADLLVRTAILRRQLYNGTPDKLWLSLHALIQEAERTHLLTKSFQHGNREAAEPSLQARYIAFALLNTASPEGMPAHEIPPLHAYLLHLASQTTLGATLHNQPGSFLLLHLECDAPPVLEHDIATLNAIDARLIDPAPVIHALRLMLAQSDQDHLLVRESAVVLSRATIERCIERLGERAERKSQRSTAKGIACLWSGRCSVIHRLQQRANIPQAWRECVNAPPEASPPPEEIIHLDREGVDAPPRETLRLTPLRRSHSADELWEMVSQRHLIEDKQTGGKTSDHSPQPAGDLKPSKLIHGMSLLDASLQGLRLRGPSPAGQPLKVGDPLLIEFPDASRDGYVIGVLRWQKSLGEQHVEVGIEVLAHSALPLRVSAPQSNTTAWFDALIMTQSMLGNAPLIMLPNNNYHAGSVIMTSHEGTMVQLRLGRKMLQTAAIAVFQFRGEHPAEDEAAYSMPRP